VVVVTVVEVVVVTVVVVGLVVVVVVAVVVVVVVTQVPIPSQVPPTHAVPKSLKVHADVQHDAGVPFAAPSSHCSPPSIVPLPHGEMVVVVVVLVVVVVVVVGVTQTPAPSQVPPVHGVPDVWKVQVDVQHDAGVPFAPPSSHCSLTLASIVLLPHSEVKVTVTKCPSFDCVRPGLPGYSHASQPEVEPTPWPIRTAASHELLRTLPFQVKVSACDCPTPLLVLNMVALPVWLKGMLTVVSPLPIAPGSASERVPELSATLELPVIPLVSADPWHPTTSEIRPMSPVRRVAKSSR
jgi:hypothetical protein